MFSLYSLAAANAAFIGTLTDVSVAYLAPPVTRARLYLARVFGATQPSSYDQASAASQPISSVPLSSDQHSYDSAPGDDFWEHSLLPDSTPDQVYLAPTPCSPSVNWPKTILAGIPSIICICLADCILLLPDRGARNAGVVDMYSPRILLPFILLAGVAVLRVVFLAARSYRSTRALGLVPSALATPQPTAALEPAPVALLPSSSAPATKKKTHRGTRGGKRQQLRKLRALVSFIFSHFLQRWMNSYTGEEPDIGILFFGDFTVHARKSRTAHVY